MELAAYRLFAEPGRFPFSVWQLAAAVGFSTYRPGRDVERRAARPLHGLFWVYGAACLVAFVVPSSVGANIERIRYAALPIAVLAVSLRRWRPLQLVVPVIALAALWNVAPIVSNYARASADPGSTAPRTGSRRSRTCTRT